MATIEQMKLSALSNYGLKPETRAWAGFRNPDGSAGSFTAPADMCFRCMGVCPGYWSMESLTNYAHGHGIVKNGADVWYEMLAGQVRIDLA